MGPGGIKGVSDIEHLCVVLIGVQYPSYQDTAYQVSTPPPILTTQL